MATTQASATHDQPKSPVAIQQTPQGQTSGQRQHEQGSESSPPLHRYLGNSYVQAMTSKTNAWVCKPNSRSTSRAISTNRKRTGSPIR